MEELIPSLLSQSLGTLQGWEVALLPSHSREGQRDVGPKDVAGCPLIPNTDPMESLALAETTPNKCPWCLWWTWQETWAEMLNYNPEQMSMVSMGCGRKPGLKF